MVGLEETIPGTLHCTPIISPVGDGKNLLSGGKNMIRIREAARLFNRNEFLMNYLWAPWRMPYLKNDLTDNDSECIFCVKTNTDDDAAEHVLYRSEHCFVTLNLYPYTNGHLLVVPYTHTGQLEDLSAEVAAGLMLTAQKAVNVLRAAYQPEAYNMGINQGAAAGAGVAGHLHMHIVPRWKGDTNYMTVVGETRVIPEWIDETYMHLKTLWDQYYPPGAEE